MTIQKYFANYIQQSPLDEIVNNASRQNDGEHCQFNSLSGRGICILMIPVHMANLLVKPLIYTAFAITKMATCIFSSFVFAVLKILGENPNMRLPLRELVKSGKYALCVIAAPIGQLLQISKAAIGVIIPAAYFKNSLSKEDCCRQIAQVASDFKLQQEFVNALNNLPEKIKDFNGYQQVAAEVALRKICERLNDPRITDEQKMEVLATLNPYKTERDRFGVERVEDDRGSINGCNNGIVNCLQRAADLMAFPKEAGALCEWLLGRYKYECLREMASKKGGESTHVLSGMIKTIGEDIEMPQEFIDQANNDGYNGFYNHRDQAIFDFKLLCTRDGFIDYIQTFLHTHGRAYQATVKKDLVDRRFNHLTEADREAMAPHLSGLDWDDLDEVQQKQIVFATFYRYENKFDCEDLNRDAIEDFCRYFDPNNAELMMFFIRLEQIN